LYKDLCYRGVGQVVRDPSICDKIQSQQVKDCCYNDVAILKLDASLCDMIQEQAKRESCHEIFKKLQ